MLKISVYAVSLIYFASQCTHGASQCVHGAAQCAHGMRHNAHILRHNARMVRHNASMVRNSRLAISYKKNYTKQTNLGKLIKNAFIKSSYSYVVVDALLGLQI